MLADRMLTSDGCSLIECDVLLELRFRLAQERSLVNSVGCRLPLVAGAQHVWRQLEMKRGVDAVEAQQSRMELQDARDATN